MYICVIKLRNIDKSKIEVKRIISEIANGCKYKNLHRLKM